MIENGLLITILCIAFSAAYPTHATTSSYGRYKFRQERQFLEKNLAVGKEFDCSFSLLSNSSWHRSQKIAETLFFTAQLLDHSNQATATVAPKIKLLKLIWVRPEVCPEKGSYGKFRFWKTMPRFIKIKHLTSSRNRKHRLLVTAQLDLHDKIRTLKSKRTDVEWMEKILEVQYI